MPRELEQALMKSWSRGRAKGKLGGVDRDTYTFGTMNKMGAMKGNKTTAKGRSIEKKMKKGCCP
jgi:hypothetical protein